MTNNTYLGFGLGLRPKHYKTIVDTQPKDIDWFEIITEDYLVAGGHHMSFLQQIREQYPVVMHGVSLSIGSCDPLNRDYLAQVKHLATAIKPAWISDHLCWTGVDGLNTHDLLPMPYTQEALIHIVERVKQVQDYLGCQILLENVSSYITYVESEMTEWEFLSEVAKQADCLLLLDVNNIYVSAFNHGFNPHDYLYGVPRERVRQFHLAGHHNFGTHIIDTHDAGIIKQVWQLYADAVKHFDRVSTLIERDDHIPPLQDLIDELEQAKAVAKQIDPSLLLTAENV